MKDSPVNNCIALADTMGEVMFVSKQSVYFKIPGLHGIHEIKQIKRDLDEIPGVLSVSANEQDDRVAVDYDSTGTNVSAIEKRLKGICKSVELLGNEDHIM